MSGHLKIHDLHFRPFLSAEQIKARVQELGRQLAEDYAGRQPLFIVVLNGAFIFAADLAKHCPIEADFTFIRLSSYQGTTSTGTVRKVTGLNAPLGKRHVILIEDIIDTGRTLHSFLPELRQQNPASVAVVTLLSKPDARRVPFKADYTGFDIPDKFVVGYGLDYNERGRNLPAIYQLDES